VRTSAPSDTVPSEMALRIVVADDDDALLALLQLQLADEPGIEVVGAAGTAAETLRLVGETAPDAVVVDLRLPDADGTELVDRLRSRYPRALVVAYSGSTDPAMRSELAVRDVPVVPKGDRAALLDELRARAEQA
jgi:DNA-binding NarL/FixJ family response regulator